MHIKELGKFDSLLEDILQASEGFLVDGQELLPTVHLINTQSGECNIVGLAIDMRDGEQKDNAADMARQKAVEINADLAIFISEVYTVRMPEGLTPEQQSVMMDMFRARYGAVRNMPSRIVCRMLQVEYSDKTWVSMEEIKGDVGQPRVLTDHPDFQESGTTGRFGNFLPRLKRSR